MTKTPYDDDDFDDDDFDDDNDLDDGDFDDTDCITGDEYVETTENLFIVRIEDVGYCYEVSIKVTPHTIDGQRHIDVIDAENLRTGCLVDYPRKVVTDKQLNDAVDSLIWSIENDEDLNDEDRKTYLACFQ